MDRHYFLPGIRMQFKRCPLCGAVWATKEDFLDDALVHLNGYQFSSRKAEIKKSGFLLFTHRQEDCGTTMAVIAEEFKERQKNR
jgi:hypothetical protein